MNIFDELSSEGEVGPASGVVAGSNQIAATGAGNGGVVPVPVAAQPQSWYVALRLHLLITHRNLAAQDLSDGEARDQHWHEHHGPGGLRLHDQPPQLHDWTALQPVPVAAMRPLATVRCPECGGGVTAVVEALTVGAVWPKHYRKDVAQGCSHWGMFHLIRPEHIEAPVPVAAQPEDEAENRWNEAIDWLLNSRYTADPDIQGPFWAYVDGVINREELGTFSAQDVLAREVGQVKCADCGDWVHTLSSREWCDGCEEEAEQATASEDADELLRRGAAPLVDHNLETPGAALIDMGYMSLPAEIHRAADEHVAGTGSADPDGGQ